MRAQKNAKKGKKDDKRLGWDDWQRYVQKETQRLMKKSGAQVVEVKLSEAEARQQRQKEEASKASSEHHGPDPSEGRRPPVPGVPREEALQVNDDEIGRTVKPFRVQDYRNIRPMSSPDLFKPVPDAVHREIEPQRVEETEDYPPYEESTEGEPEIGSSVEPVAAVAVEERPAKGVKVETVAPAAVKPKAEAPQVDVEPKRRGRKKKLPSEELDLFSGGVPEHQASGRRRLTKKGRLEREELIEKLLDPVISLEEAATLIGVCKTTVRRYTNRDELECLRTPGQQRRFKLSQVLEFVKRREQDEKSRHGRGGKGK